MDYKRNSLFFHHKRTLIWTRISYLSYLFFAVGVILFISTGLNYLAVAMPPVIVGVVILLTSLNMMTGEGQIKQQIEVLREAAKEEGRTQLGYPEEDPDHFYEFEGYDLFDPALPIRKNRNGRSFSTRYTVTFFLLEKNTLRVFERTASLVEEYAQVFSQDIPLVSLAGAEILSEKVRRLCISGSEQEITRHMLLLRDGEGKILCRAFCKIYDYDMERFRDSLVHAIAKAKEDAGELPQ